MLSRAATLLACLIAIASVTIVPTPAAADDPPSPQCGIVVCNLKVEKPAVPGQRAPNVRRPNGSASAAPRAWQCAATCGAGVENIAPRGGPVSPAQAAQQAVAVLRLQGPQIEVAPAPDGAGLVGLPVWLWTVQTPQTWGPIQRTAAVTGLAVTMRAKAQRVTWDVGDGAEVVCEGPGTPYDAEYGNTASPDCGHRYGTSSRDQPAGVYTITGTTTWRVTWWTVGGGPTGVITTTAQSSTTIQIDEMQVVTT